MPNPPQLMRCPACGASLEPAAGQGTMKCVYCKSSVFVPGEGGHLDNVMAAEAPWKEKVLERVRAGHKIEAIKLFREATRASLTGAKNVVDAIERGEDIDTILLQGPESPGADDFAGRSLPGKNIAIVLAAVALLIAGAIAAIVLMAQK